MSITDKTRKTLWARSGNRCAMCREELVAERNQNNRNLNIGDECHIISKRLKGPRHIVNYDRDFDDYDNLILLCKNHHKTIDELWETYTIDLLKSFKSNHEEWIRTVIENARDGNKCNLRLLPRLTTGKQIVDIIQEAHAYHFDHSDLKNENETGFIAGFFQNLKDWGDISGFVDFEIGRQVQLGYDLNKELEELESRGFFLFGERKRSKVASPKEDDLGDWDIAILVVLRQNDPAIIDDEKILTQTRPTSI